MTETIAIEFSDEEEEMIAKVAQMHGQTVEEYCQAFLKWITDPENKELAEELLQRAISKEKSRTFEPLETEE